MNIKEAIDHCQEVIANTNNTSCQLDHRQLIDWLTELHNLKILKNVQYRIYIRRC